ncbi:MAG TPA: transposase [Spirochaetia bacterium]|nr:transposase [Spirochaetales bacterium]HRY81403.1 transposase [Spirochaetia bacterium]HRZ90428.1 transposase [Spirochaetia bacterium]
MGTELDAIISSSVARIAGMRKPRELREGARYHVTGRANRKELIFDTGAMKDLFLSVVKRAKRKYAFRIENFCIMGNHFHLVIIPGKGMSLSTIMQWIMSVFAMAYNRICGYTGHVWGERFFSRILSGFRELLAVFAYIDNNPVQASLIEDPRKWRFGGLWHNRTGCRDIVEVEPSWLPLTFPERGMLLLTN